MKRLGARPDPELATGNRRVGGEQEPPPAAAPAAGRARRRATPWRDNVEALTVAIVMAVVLKYFAVEAYKIPTGSMQPTLMGSPEARVFDRILVDKLSFHFRDPERWEIVIFKYPLDRAKNFVKRVVGLPGEWIRIAHGDVWTRPDERSTWTIPRRPRPVLEEMLKPLDLTSEDDSGPSPWAPAPDASGWVARGRRIEAPGPGKARFGAGRGSIRDEYLDGYPPTLRRAIEQFVAEHPGSRAQVLKDPAHNVGDLRVEARARPGAGCAWVGFELDEGTLRYALRVPGPAAPAGAVPEVRVTDTSRAPLGADRSWEAQGEPLRLEAGSWTRLAGQNIDDRLTLEVDGRVVAELDVPPAPNEPSAAWVRLEGGGGELEELQVLRDVYYADGNLGLELAIPPDSYCMLGDNTQNSSDSREWMLERMRVPDGEGGNVVVQGNQLRAPGNPPTNNPFEFHPSEGGSWFRFRDEWGEPWIRQVRERQMLSPERAPLVPRELITGRALLVFWPVLPLRGVHRLEWIH